MNDLISLALKNNNFPMLKILWGFQSIYTKKYETEVWVDNEGNTLAHYACLHHDNQIWEFAKNKPRDLKHLNNNGESPIHVFIKNSFVKNEMKERKSFKKQLLGYWISFLSKIEAFVPYVKEYLSSKLQPEDSSISISFNKELLKDLIVCGADINQFREYPERKELGWTTTDYGSFSIKDNMGSPLELLIYYFWEFILYSAVRLKNEKVVEEYYDFFHTLTSLGANANLIVQGNTNDQAITDAMESYPSRLVSIFFIKFIAKEDDYFAIRPFLIDEYVNFMAIDDSGNTLLHTLFARLSARKNKFSDEFCEQVFRDISKNKQLTVAVLELKNQFNMAPIDLLRGEGEHLRKYFDSFLMHEDLNKTLKSKPEIKETKAIRKI